VVKFHPENRIRTILLLMGKMREEFASFGAREITRNVNRSVMQFLRRIQNFIYAVRLLVQGENKSEIANYHGQ
jgi:hypothetical protein